MLKTNSDYVDACSYIDSDTEMYDFKLSDKMLSYEYNLYLQDAEYFLDTLYVKTRTLEDICNYLETYVKTKIDLENKKISDALEKIENAIDKYLKSSSVSLYPQWNFHTQIKDRDGKTINSVTVDKQKISINGTKNNFIDIKSILKMGTDLAHSSGVLGDKNDSYLSLHSDDACGTISESLKIIPMNTNYNVVSLDPINCDIEIDKQKDGTLLLNLTANNYTKDQEEFDYNAYNGSNLNKLRQNDYGYDSTKPIADNINLMVDIMNQNKTKKYYKDILDYQKSQDNLNNKSETLDTYI